MIRTYAAATLCLVLIGGLAYAWPLLVTQAVDAAVASGAGVWIGGAVAVGVAVLVVARLGRRVIDRDFETEARRALRRENNS